MQSAKGLLFVILINVLIAGCQKEKIIVYQPSWKPHPQFKLAEKVKFNSYSANDQLYFYGPNYFAVLDKGGKLQNYFTALDYPYGKKLSISKDLFVEASLVSKYMRVAKVRDPVINDLISPLIDLKQFDSNFLNFNFDWFAYNQCFAINNRNQILIEVYTDTPGNKVYVYLLDIDISSGLVKISNFKKIEIPGIANLFGGYPNYVKAIDDFFLVSTSEGVVKIYSNGIIKKVLNSRILEAFKKNGRTFAFFEPDKLFISTDDGETWQSFIGINANVIVPQKYNIGDSLSFYIGSQIFSAKFTEQTYAVRELKNDGLEDIQITSISDFNDTIFVTTYSGVFFKPKNKFFESKK